MATEIVLLIMGLAAILFLTVWMFVIYAAYESIHDRAVMEKLIDALKEQ